MRSYNGFSSSDRNTAQTWLRSLYEHGAIARPQGPCCACGQKHGVFDHHAEDYSRPFGAHIYAHVICYRCHMMLHCRFRNAAAFERYVAFIRDGWIFQPVRGRDFGAVARQLAGIDPPAIRPLLVEPTSTSWFDRVLWDQTWKTECQRRPSEMFSPM